MSRWLGERLHEVVAVAPRPGLRAGDEVRIALAESALLRAAVLAYGVPLVAMLGGSLLAAAVSGGADAPAAAGAAAGLAVGVLVGRLLSRRAAADPSLVPVVLQPSRVADD